MQKTSIICKYLVVLLMSVLTIHTVSAQKFSPSSYIAEHKEVAQELMKETGVPASVILGVAFHESAYGNSRIAKHLNNHFGIKGKNKSKVIRSAYKGYQSVKESYLDFVGLLKRRKATAPLFEDYSHENYQAWVKGIAKSGYSETRTWSAKVLATIERYDLDAIDAEVYRELEENRLAVNEVVQEKEDLLLQQMSLNIQEDVFDILNTQLIIRQNLSMEDLKIKSRLSANDLINSEQRSIL